MKSLFTIAILSLASFAAGCSNKTADVGESDYAALEEHETPYVGDFRASTPTDEIQTLSLKEDNTFRGLIAKALLGEEECVLAPCLAEVSGKWTVSTGAKATLTLIPTGKGDIRYDISESPIEGLKLTRGTTALSLVRFIDCPQVPNVEIACEGETVATYDKNGCYQGLSCVVVAPPAVCEAVIEDATAVCDGTWKANYSAVGCYTGRTCVPTPPPAPPVP